MTALPHDATMVSLPLQPMFYVVSMLLVVGISRSQFLSALPSYVCNDPQFTLGASPALIIGY